MSSGLTSAQQRRISEVLRIVDVCEIYLCNSMNLPGSKLQVTFHHEYSLPCCIFKSPDRIILDYRKTLVLSIAELKGFVYDAMASCALYREYMSDVEKYRTAVQAKFAPRPKLLAFRSGKWTYYRNRLAQFC